MSRAGGRNLGWTKLLCCSYLLLKRSKSRLVAGGSCRRKATLPEEIQLDLLFLMYLARPSSIAAGSHQPSPAWNSMHQLSHLISRVQEGMDASIRDCIALHCLGLTRMFCYGIGRHNREARLLDREEALPDYNAAGSREPISPSRPPTLHPPPQHMRHPRAAQCHCL